jgi:hypothetical protein
VNTTTPKPNLLAMLFFWVVYFAGCAFFWHFVHPALHAEFSHPESWQQTEARVLEKGMYPCWRGGRAPGTTNLPMQYVKYEYTIDDITHTSYRVRPDDLNDPCSGIDGDDLAWLASYPVGSKIVAYVNPDSSGEDALRPAIHSRDFLGWVFILLLLVLMIKFAFSFLLISLGILLSLFAPSMLGDEK